MYLRKLLCFVALIVATSPWLVAIASASTFPSLGAFDVEVLAPDGVNTFELPSAAPLLLCLPIPEAGVIAVDTVVPIRAHYEFDLKLAAFGCGDVAQRVQVILQRPGSLLLRASESGSVALEVELVRGHGPATVAIHTAFAAEPQSPEVTTLLTTNPPASCASAGIPVIETGDQGFARVIRPAIPRRDVEPDDCDVLEGAAPEPGVLIVGAQGGRFDAAVFSGETCEQAIADGSLGAPGESLVVPLVKGKYLIVLGSNASQGLSYELNVYLPLCASSGDGQLLRCARPADETPIEGVLTLGGEQYFTFVISRQQKVELMVHGESIVSALYDDAGLRLTMDPACQGFLCQWTSALPAGRYYLRLANLADRAMPFKVSIDSRADR